MGGNPESQVLDCKRIGDEGDMKKNLAVVLSGFANGQGGVCLWGVTAKKNSQGIDCIDAFPGVDDARRVASRFDELTPQAVSPGTAGVVHRAIVPRSESRGFVATFVPASDGGPHMARFGEDRYYQRIGLSFSRMEPFQIADMFGRRARPSLKVSLKQWNPFEYRVQIENVGRGPARGLFIQVTAPAPFHRNLMGIDGNRNEVIPYAGNHSAGTWLHAGDAGMLLHPTMSVMIGGVWLAYDVSQYIAARSIPAILEVGYKVGALDVAPQEGTLRADLRPHLPSGYICVLS